MIDNVIPTPAANENHNPLSQADTALDELYRLRRGVLAEDTSRYTFAELRERQTVLKGLDAGIRLCLSKY